MTTLATRRIASPLIRLLFVVVLALGMASTAQSSVFVSVAIAPPAIPVYSQPVCPGPGYIWVPGYWAWDAGEGYYWVPGYWTLAPFVGALWTPGWWGWGDGVYVWHAGYWGRHVGFYGGIDYGFGYFGVGYSGGYWRSGRFYYNTAVTNVNTTIVNNVYNRPVAQTTTTRVSFNGGPGGISRQPTAEERLAQRDSHRSATPIQLQHEHLARADRGQWASANHGTPSVMATSKAAAFAGRGAGQRAAVPGAVASAPAHREPRVQSGRPEAHAQGPQVHREARVEHHAAQLSAPPVHHEARVEHRAAQPSAPVHREARVEHRAPPATAAAPHEPMARRETHAQVAPRPETHAQSAARAETHAPAPFAPRPEMRTQNTPRPEAHAPVAPRPERQVSAAPRPEMHAQNAPRMQAPAGPPHAESRGAHPGGERREEEHGPR